MEPPLGRCHCLHTCLKLKRDQFCMNQYTNWYAIFYKQLVKVLVKEYSISYTNGYHRVDKSFNIVIQKATKYDTFR